MLGIIELPSDYPVIGQFEITLLSIATTLSSIQLVYLILHSTWDLIISAVSSYFTSSYDWYYEARIFFYSTGDVCILTVCPLTLYHQKMVLGQRDLNLCFGFPYDVSNPFNSFPFHSDLRRWLWLPGNALVYKCIAYFLCPPISIYL